MEIVWIVWACAAAFVGGVFAVCLAVLLIDATRKAIQKGRERD